jgi:hypothetical protein
MVQLDFVVLSLFDFYEKIAGVTASRICGAPLLEETKLQSLGFLKQASTCSRLLKAA